jgi:hypothetical protein
MRINYLMVVRLAGSLLLGGFCLTADIDVAHGAPIHPEGQVTIVAAAPTDVPTVSSLRLLGYGLFLVNIGLKPFQSSRLADLKLGDRVALPQPELQSQS